MTIIRTGQGIFFRLFWVHKMTLRPYQQAAHDAAWKHVRYGLECIVK